jgi:hypothetical protein
MTDPILVTTLLLAFAGAAATCGAFLSRRAHDRRVEARIQESIHLYAVVRAFFAERHSPV